MIQIPLSPRAIESLGYYREAHRVYHTVQHVLDMLSFLAEGTVRGHTVVEAYRAPVMDARQRESLVEAICAHDICVAASGQPAKGVLEINSVDLWLRSNRAMGDRVDLGLVDRLVLATIDHELPVGVPLVSSDGKLTDDGLVALMIDLDFIGFANTAEHCWKDTLNVMEEGVNPAGGDRLAVLDRTRTFLSQMMTRKPFYGTRLLEEQCGDRARKNAANCYRQTFSDDTMLIWAKL